MPRLSRFARTIGTAAVLAAGIGPLQGQGQPAAGPAAPAGPASQPVGPAQGAPTPATEPATQPTTGPATRPASISLSFKDVPIDTVLDHLSEAAGFVVVKEAPVDGRVTVLSKQPVTPDEAVAVLNAVLKTNGFTAIQTGRVLKIVAREKAKKAGIPVHFGAKPEDVEATDELITQVIPVATVNALRLRQDLTPLIGPDADVTANGGSNALIVTDTSANIRRVVQIVSALDKNEATAADLRRYSLKNANAAATAVLVMALFKPADAPAQRGQQQDGGGGQRQGAGRQQTVSASVNAVADDRTNTLFVVAPAEAQRVVADVIKELEANPSTTSEIRVFQPKFADAAAAAKLIAAVFRPDEGGPPRPDGQPRPRRGPAATPGTKVPVVAAADERSNTLVVTAPADTLRVIDDVLKKLDVDPSDVSEVKVITLAYADATAAAKLVTSIFRAEPSKAPAAGAAARPAGAADGVVNARVNAAADERTNAIVLTAPKETIGAIENVLKLLDVNPATAAVVKVLPLKNADAASAAALVTMIFKLDDPSVLPPGAPKPAAADAISAAERARRARMTAAPDSRTNALVVSAPPELLKEIEGVVAELDANPASEESFFIYRLKNGQAANVEAVLNSMFASSGLPGANGPFGPGAGRFPQNIQGAGGRAGAYGQSPFGGALGALGGAFGSRSGGTGIGQRRGTQSSSFGGAFGAAYPGGVFPGGALGGYGRAGLVLPQLSAGNLRAVTELTGQVYVVADPDTNALLVTTATKFQQRVKDIIQELDRPVPQVLIKVLVAEVTHDNSADFGVDFSILNKRPSGNGASGGANFGNAAAGTGAGGLVVSLLEANINATLHALATEGKLDVLSRPYILASDNQLASITVGQEVPFITDTRLTDNGQTINTIQYQDVGIILNVTPHINPDGQVILDVAPEISQLTGTTVAISETVSAPVIAKRSAESRVGIKNGQTIVIGGLMEDRKTLTLHKVPLLGDLPLIGPAFARTETSKTKTELLIFLTPHVALEPDHLKAMSADEAAGTKLAPNAVGPGVFEDHLKGLQRGATPTATQPATTQPAETRPAP